MKGYNYVHIALVACLVCVCVCVCACVCVCPALQSKMDQILGANSLLCRFLLTVVIQESAIMLPSGCPANVLDLFWRRWNSDGLAAAFDSLDPSAFVNVTCSTQDLNVSEVSVTFLLCCECELGGLVADL